MQLPGHFLKGATLKISGEQGQLFLKFLIEIFFEIPGGGGTVVLSLE